MFKDADVTSGNLRMSMRMHIRILPFSWTTAIKTISKDLHHEAAIDRPSLTSEIKYSPRIVNLIVLDVS